VQLGEASQGAGRLSFLSLLDRERNSACGLIPTWQAKHFLQNLQRSVITKTKKKM
jgi:hypothetical protein